MRYALGMMLGRFIKLALGVFRRRTYVRRARREITSVLLAKFPYVQFV